jgi:hypothetical protein
MHAASVCLTALLVLHPAAGVKTRRRPIEFGALCHVLLGEQGISANDLENCAEGRRNLSTIHGAHDVTCAIARSSS